MISHNGTITFIILCQNLKNHQFLAKFLKIINFCENFQNIIIFGQNLKNRHFFTKFEKSSIFAKISKNHQFLWKFSKYYNFLWKFSKNHHFWPKFSSFITFLSITLVSPVSRDQSHSLSIAIVLRHFCDTGMSTCKGLIVFWEMWKKLQGFEYEL